MGLVRERLAGALLLDRPLFPGRLFARFAAQLETAGYDLPLWLAAGARGQTS